jgi:MFS family permease
MLQGAADAMTWVVGLALIADLYGEDERGGAMGLAMAGSSLGIIIGPVIGGWLYEIGGIRLPFFAVAALAGVDLVAFSIVTPKTEHVRVAATSIRDLLKVRPIFACAVMVVAAAATMAMLEPVMPLLFESRFGLGPASIGTLFGMAALASAAMHPLYGRLSDRWGGRRLMLAGLLGSAAMLPVMNLATDFRSAAFVMVPMWMISGMIITPSLTYFAQMASRAGVEAYGVVYGVYNVAWAVGLMSGPAIGGFLFERIGFARLTVGWSVLLVTLSLIFARLR